MSLFNQIGMSQEGLHTSVCHSPRHSLLLVPQLVHSFVTLLGHDSVWLGTCLAICLYRTLMKVSLCNNDTSASAPVVDFADRSLAKISPFPSLKELRFCSSVSIPSFHSLSSAGKETPTLGMGPD